MGRAPCCDKANVKKGPWSPEEDAKLKEYIEKFGTGGNWIALPQKAGLKRCGKSCRLRWLNYLRPNIKHGEFSDDEDKIICSLFANIGSRWSIIAAQLPGRTDNDIKNYWNTKLKKKLMGFFPASQRKITHQAALSSLLQTSSSSSTTSSNSSFNGSRSSYYNTAAGSFTGLEPISFTPNVLFSSNCSPNAAEFLQAQETFVRPIQNYHVNMFGSEPSCSSSDGSSNNLQNCFYNGVEENQRFMVSIGEETTPLDYDLEEIKQLISSSNCNNNHFMYDENKTGERFMYY